MQLSKKSQKIVEKATVWLIKYGGQGILVNGNLIITAAHCVEYGLPSEMIYGDFYVQEIETWQGKRLKVTPLFIEPITDMAVLGFNDYIVFPQDATLFDKFCETIKPIPLYMIDQKRLFYELPVFIYYQKGGWVTGTATGNFNTSPIFTIVADQHIIRGTSGGPIVNEAGELVAIVSNFSQTGVYDGTAPSPYLILPPWLSWRIASNWQNI
jgi:hypothetical protein